MVADPGLSPCEDEPSMGPGIVIPVLIVTVAVPVVLLWARRRFKEGDDADGDQQLAAAGRLTSKALRSLPSPPWRVVYEIAHEKLDGVEHVLIGPPGVFAIVTSMDPMPAAAVEHPDPHQIAAPAIKRGTLDDALRRCAMTSDRLVTVHWGIDEASRGTTSVDVVPGAIAVDGRQIETWAAAVGARDRIPLSPAQVDLAWQTVVTGIGRPDPLK